MTIRFLNAWNGYDDQDIATLSSEEESRLVGLGLATYTIRAERSAPATDSMVFESLADIPAGVVGPVYDVSGNLAFGNGERVTPRGTKNIGKATIVPFGTLNSTNTPTALTGGLALPIPVKFNAVRIGYMHLGASGVGATAGTTLLVAESDDMGLLDYNYTAAPGDSTAEFRKFIEPHLGGAKYNSIVAAGNPGWKQVTFAGADTVDIDAPATGAVSVTWSDLITLEGVADINDESVFPLLIRLFNGTGAYTRQSNITGIVTLTNARDEMGKLAPKFASRSTNGVATPSNWTTGFTPSFTDSNWPPLAIELYTEGRLVSVSFIGDSRFALSTELTATKRFLNAPVMLQNILTERGINVQLQQLSGAGWTSEQYLSRALPALESNNKPDYAIYIIYSINDGSPTAALVNASKVRLHQFLDTCYERQTIPIILTAFPILNGFTEQKMVLLVGLESYARNMGLAVISPLALLGTASNGDWLPGMGFDGNHASQAGYQVLAEEIAKYIS